MSRACVFLCTLLLLGANRSQAQTRTINGRILVQGTEQPLVGAVITVTGARAATCTGFDGTFQVQVARDEEAHLQITVPGWAGEAVVPPGQNEVTLQLERGVIPLPEMVINGQATSVPRRSSANAIATVTGEQLTKVPAQTIESALQGKVVGASIKQNSGAPGGGMQMTLRGLTSILLSSDPLIVVDGVIISNAAIPSGTHYITGVTPNQTNPVNRLADINPNDIETVEVLKGASAAAMYGMRASNGVVLITTKHGKARYETPQPEPGLNVVCAAKP